ncbi:hypothetical protein AB2H66_00890 [Escherichia coli]
MLFRWHWLLERENNAPDNITGANLEPEQLKNSRETLAYDARRAAWRFSGSGQILANDRELAEQAEVTCHAGVRLP